MSSLDYTNQNALIRYPFKDNATLAWEDGTIGNDIFLDAQFTTFGNSVIIPGLKSISKASNTYTIVFSLAVGNDLTFSFTYPASAEVLSARSTDNKTAGRISCNGEALNSYFTENAVPTTINFTPADNRVCVSTVRYACPIVTQITCKNYRETNGTRNDQTILDIDTDSGLMLLEGTNVQLSGAENASISVIPGAGQGYYGTCEPIKGVIYKINDVGASTFGSYSITGDTCYSIIGNTGIQPGISLTNSCKPACSEEDLKAFAHYLNRVRDTSVDLATYIGEIKAGYDALIDKYKKLLAVTNGLKSPYMLGECTTAGNLAADYHSIALAIYSPSKENIYGTLTVGPTNAGVHPVYSVVPNTASLIQDGIKNQITATAFSQLGFVERAMKCNDVIYHNFVVTNPKIAGLSPLNTGEGKFDLEFKLASLHSNAYFRLPLLSTVPNFTVSYTVLDVEGIRKIKVTVDLLYRANTSLATSLVFDFPGFFTMTSGSLILNQVQEIELPGHYGFTEQLIDYSKKATCYFELEADNPALDSYDTDITLTTSLGVVKKTIPIVCTSHS